MEKKKEGESATRWRSSFSYSLSEKKKEKHAEEEEKKEEEEKGVFLLFSPSRLGTPRKRKRDEVRGQGRSCLSSSSSSSSSSQGREEGETGEGREEEEEEEESHEDSPWASTPSTSASLSSEWRGDLSSLSSSSSSFCYPPPSFASSSCATSLFSPSSPPAVRGDSPTTSSPHAASASSCSSSSLALLSPSSSSLFVSSASSLSSSSSSPPPPATPQPSSPPDDNRRLSRSPRRRSPPSSPHSLRLPSSSSRPSPLPSFSSSSSDCSSLSSQKGLVVDPPLFSRVRRLQRRSLMKLTGSDEGAYGENCCASLWALFRLLQEKFFFSSSSVFLDIGSGSGIPSFLAAATVGCISTLGVELDSNVYFISCDNHLHLVDQRLLSSLENLNHFLLFHKSFRDTTQHRIAQGTGVPHSSSSSSASPPSSASSSSSLSIVQAPVPSYNSYPSSPPPSSSLSASLSPSTIGKASRRLQISPSTSSLSKVGRSSTCWRVDEEANKERKKKTLRSFSSSPGRDSVSSESLTRLTEKDILFTCAGVSVSEPMRRTEEKVQAEEEGREEQPRSSSILLERTARRTGRGKRGREEEEEEGQEVEGWREEALHEKGGGHALCRVVPLQSSRFISPSCSFLPLSSSSSSLLCPNNHSSSTALSLSPSFSSPPSSSSSSPFRSNPSGFSTFSSESSASSSSPPPPPDRRHRQPSSSSSSSLLARPPSPSSPSSPPACTNLFSLPGGLAYPCNTAFRCMDASLLKSLGGVTHIFSFDLAMPPWILLRLCRLFNLSTSPIVYVSFHSDLASRFSLRAVLAQRFRMRMSGSGESHVAFIYVKKCVLPSSSLSLVPRLSFSSSYLPSSSSSPTTSSCQAYDDGGGLSSRQRQLASPASLGETQGFARDSFGGVSPSCPLGVSSPSSPEEVFRERRRSTEQRERKGRGGLLFPTSSFSLSSHLSSRTPPSLQMFSSSEEEEEEETARGTCFSRKERESNLLLAESEARAILLRGMSEGFTQRFFNVISLEGFLPFVSRLLLFCTLYLARFLSSSSSSSSRFSSRKGVQRAQEEDEGRGEGVLPDVCSYALKWWMDLSFSFAYLPQQQMSLLRRIFSAFGIDNLLEVQGHAGLEDLRALLLLPRSCSSSPRRSPSQVAQGAPRCVLCGEEDRGRQGRGTSFSEVSVQSNDAGDCVRRCVSSAFSREPRQLDMPLTNRRKGREEQAEEEAREWKVWRECLALLASLLPSTPERALCIHRVEEIALWLKSLLVSRSLLSDKRPRADTPLRTLLPAVFNEDEREGLPARSGSSCERKALPSVSREGKEDPDAKKSQRETLPPCEKELRGFPPLWSKDAFSCRVRLPLDEEEKVLRGDDDGSGWLEILLCPRIERQIDHMREKQRPHCGGGSTLFDRLIFGENAQGQAAFVQSCRRSARARKDLFFSSSSSASPSSSFPLFRARRKAAAFSQHPRGLKEEKREEDAEGRTRRSSKRRKEFQPSPAKAEDEEEERADEEEKCKKFLFQSNGNNARKRARRRGSWIHVATVRWCSPNERIHSGVCTPGKRRRDCWGGAWRGVEVKEKRHRNTCVLKVPCFSPLCYVCGEREMLSQILSSAQAPPVKQYLLQKEMQGLQKTPLIQLLDNEGREEWTTRLRQKFDRANARRAACRRGFSASLQHVLHQASRDVLSRARKEDEGGRAPEDRKTSSPSFCPCFSSLQSSSSSSFSPTSSSSDLGQTELDDDEEEEEEGRTWSRQDKTRRAAVEDTAVGEARGLGPGTTEGGRRRSALCLHGQREKILEFLEAFFSLGHQRSDLPSESEEEENDWMERRRRMKLSMPVYTTCSSSKQVIPRPACLLTSALSEDLSGNLQKRRSVGAEVEDGDEDSFPRRQARFFSTFDSCRPLLWREEHQEGGHLPVRTRAEEDRGGGVESSRLQSPVPFPAQEKESPQYSLQASASAEKRGCRRVVWRARFLSVRRRKVESKERLREKEEDEGEQEEKEKKRNDSRLLRGEREQAERAEEVEEEGWVLDLQDQRSVSLADFSCEWVDQSFPPEKNGLRPSASESSSLFSSSSSSCEAGGSGFREGRSWLVEQLEREEAGVFLLLSLLNGPLVSLLFYSPSDEENEAKTKSKTEKEEERKQDSKKRRQTASLPHVEPDSLKGKERRSEEEEEEGEKEEGKLLGNGTDHEKAVGGFEWLGRRRNGRTIFSAEETPGSGEEEAGASSNCLQGDKTKEKVEGKGKNSPGSLVEEREEEKVVEGVEVCGRNTKNLWCWVFVLEQVLQQELLLVDCRLQSSKAPLLFPSSSSSLLALGEGVISREGELKTDGKENSKEDVNKAFALGKTRENDTRHDAKKKKKKASSGKKESPWWSVRSLLLAQILRLQQLKELKRLREEEKKKKNGEKEGETANHEDSSSSSSTTASSFHHETSNTNSPVRLSSCYAPLLSLPLRLLPPLPTEGGGDEEEEEGCVLDAEDKERETERGEENRARKRLRRRLGEEKEETQRRKEEALYLTERQREQRSPTARRETPEAEGEVERGEEEEEEEEEKGVREGLEGGWKTSGHSFLQANSGGVGRLIRQLREDEKHLSLSTAGQVASSLLFLLRHPEKKKGVRPEETEGESSGCLVSLDVSFERVQASCELLSAVESMLRRCGRPPPHQTEAPRPEKKEEEEQEEREKKTRERHRFRVESVLEGREEEERGHDSMEEEEEGAEAKGGGLENGKKKKKKDKVTEREERQRAEKAEARGVSGLSLKEEKKEEEGEERMKRAEAREEEEEEEEAVERLRHLRRTLLRRLWGVRRNLEKEKEAECRAVHTWIVNREFFASQSFSSSGSFASSSGLRHTLSSSSSSPSPPPPPRCSSFSSFHSCPSSSSSPGAGLSTSFHLEEEKGEKGEDEGRRRTFFPSNNPTACRCLLSSPLGFTQEALLREPLRLFFPSFSDEPRGSPGASDEERRRSERSMCGACGSGRRRTMRAVGRRRRRRTRESRRKRRGGEEAPCPLWRVYYWTLGCVCLHKEVIFKQKLKEILWTRERVSQGKNAEEEKGHAKSTVEGEEEKKKVEKNNEEVRKNVDFHSVSGQASTLGNAREGEGGKEKEEEAQQSEREEGGRGRRSEKVVGEREEVEVEGEDNSRMVESVRKEGHRERQEKEGGPWSVSTPALVECCVSPPLRVESQKIFQMSSDRRVGEGGGEQVLVGEGSGECLGKKSPLRLALDESAKAGQENARPREQLTNFLFLQKEKRGDADKIGRTGDSNSFLHSPKAPRKRRSLEGKVHQESRV